MVIGEFVFLTSFKSTWNRIFVFVTDTEMKILGLEISASFDTRLCYCKNTGLLIE